MDKKNINIFDLHFDASFREQFHQGVDEILDEGFLSNHTYVKKFEESFSRFNGSKYSIAVNSGTGALDLALRAIDVTGKYVFLPSNTFIATAVAIRNAGGKPVVVDIENDYFSMCSKELLHNIKKYDKSKIGAIICVHIGGHISPTFREIVKLAKLYNIDLIEDSAHAHGAKLDNTNSGNFGRFGCFSFFTTKIMTTGEGGMVTCNTETDSEKLISLRQFGKTKDDSTVHNSYGSNFKMSEFAGLMGVLELQRVQERISKRRQIAKIYHEKLDPLKYLVSCDSEGQYGTYYKQIVLSKKKNTSDIKRICKERGVAITGGVYHKPIHQQPVYSQGQERTFVKSSEFANMHFCPPCYPELTEEDIDYICRVLNDI